MKFSTSVKSNAVRMYTIALGVIVAGLVVLGNGCVGGSEGDRCNPLLSHDECGGTTLTCQQPSTCVESYCCPNPASSSSNPYCNGTLCPVVDAGPDVADAGEEASDDGGAG
jgi:hypothetical protein